MKLYTQIIVSLCKKTPNTALLSSQLPVIYKSKLPIIKTSKALSLTFSYQSLLKKIVFLLTLIDFYFAEPQFCDEYLKTKRSIKIKGYQSQKLYTTNDIPMGKTFLQNFIETCFSLLSKRNTPVMTYLKLFLFNLLLLICPKPSNSSLNLINQN